MELHDAPGSPLASTPAAVRRFARVLIDAGHAAWLVGGAVRNLLLGRPPGGWDWDVATGATPDRVQRLYRRTIPTGIRHGTVTVLFDRERFEVTTFRTDSRYTDGRRPDAVRFTGSIDQDLARRDFTINAIAVDLATGALRDPHGGRADLAARRLRTVGSAQERFAEDGLRPFRGCRLAAELDLSVDAQTVRAMRDAVPTARRVAAERVCQELRRLLAASAPSVGLRLLEQARLMPLCFPGLALPGLAGSERAAAGGAARYASIDAAPPDPPQRLAMLLAVLLTPAAAEAPAAAGRARAALVRLRFPNAVVQRAAAAIGSLSFPITARSSDADIRRLLAAVGRDGAEDAIAVRQAVGAIEPPLARRVRGQAGGGQALSIRELAVGGADLQRELGLRPGPQIGRLLSGLLQEVLADPAVNQRDRLLAAARALQQAEEAPPAPSSGSVKPSPPASSCPSASSE